MSDIKNERCVLCLDEKRSPVIIDCGHSFCFECLNVYKSYHKYAWAHKCPICRSLLKEKKRAVKRKLTSSNANTENSSATIVSPNISSSETSLSANPIEPAEDVVILEEFMALAAADSVDFNVSQENLSQTEAQAFEDSYDDDEEGVNDDDSYYDDMEDDDDDDEFSFYTDSDDEPIYYFEDGDYELAIDRTASAAYDFGEDLDGTVTDYNDTASTVAALENSSQASESDVTYLEDVIIID